MWFGLAAPQASQGCSQSSGCPPGTGRGALPQGPPLYGWSGRKLHPPQAGRSRSQERGCDEACVIPSPNSANGYVSPPVNPSGKSGRRGKGERRLVEYWNGGLAAWKQDKCPPILRKARCGLVVRAGEGPDGRQTRVRAPPLPLRSCVK